MYIQINTCSMTSYFTPSTHVNSSTNHILTHAKSTARTNVSTSPIARPSTRSSTGISRVHKSTKSKGKQVAQDLDDATFPNMRSLADCTIFIDNDTTSVEETHNTTSYQRILPRELTHPHETQQPTSATSTSSTNPTPSNKENSVPLAPLTPIDSVSNIPRTKRIEDQHITERSPSPTVQNHSTVPDPEHIAMISQQALQEFADEARHNGPSHQTNMLHTEHHLSAREAHILEPQRSLSLLNSQLTETLAITQKLAAEGVEQYLPDALNQNIPAIVNLMAMFSSQISQHMDYLDPNTAWITYQRTMERYQIYWEQMILKNIQLPHV